MAQSPQNGPLASHVPAGLVRRLREHFTGKIEEAVQRYRFNEADEDSLTGALAHALSTPERIVTVANGVTYSFAIESYKILGKGPGTPESRTGADGIFQVSVQSNGKRIFEKGLPFQAKKLNRYRATEVLPQAKDMLRTSESGIVLCFSPDGYKAADARHLVGVSTEDISTPAGFHPLGSVLGDWFLECRVGRVGLTFDRHAPDPNAPAKRGFWVIDTQIRKTAPRNL